MELQEYVDSNGRNRFERWFQTLNDSAARKVTIALSRMEAGNTSNIKWFDGIGEYRINWGPGYRVYLVQDGERLIILFGGGTKKTQQSDIRMAKKLLKEYKSTKSDG